MNTFGKNISIYGLLPVFGKFIGFFLVPIYTRIFTSEEFGTIELVVSLMNFLVYFISLEFYTAIGRFFYQQNNIEQQKRLISTGLMLTIFSGVLICSICFFMREQFISLYFNGMDVRRLYFAGLIWLFLDGLSSYLNTIPRYCKQPHKYVIVNSICILIRVLSTIIFVLVFNVGTIGIILGHITGTITSIVLNALLSSKYLCVSFEISHAKNILKYALPLVPSVIAVALWAPLMRKSIEIFYSISVLGIFAFSTRVTSVTTMFKSALINAWRPMMFENMKNDSLLSELKINSSNVSFILLILGTSLTSFAYEVCLILGTEHYLSAYTLIPFMCFSGYLQSAIQLRGVGPLLNGKTYIQSIFTIIAMLISFGCLLFIKDSLDLYGLGIIIVLYDLIQYFSLSEYTKRIYRAGSFTMWQEYIMLLLFAVSFILTIMNAPLFIRMFYFIIFIFVCYFLNKKVFHILHSKVAQ